MLLLVLVLVLPLALGLGPVLGLFVVIAAHLSVLKMKRRKKKMITWWVGESEHSPLNVKVLYGLSNGIYIGDNIFLTKNYKIEYFLEFNLNALTV